MSAPATPDPQSELLANHMHFAELHRGQVTRGPGGALIESTVDEFTCAVLEQLDPSILDRFATVRTLPWSSDWGPLLAQRGYRRAGALCYMVLAGDTGSWQVDPDVRCITVHTAEDMARFSDVQTRGFLGPGESYDWWYRWLNAVNQRNLGHPDQEFHLGLVGGEAVSVTLMVITGTVAGIYGVATLPDRRKLGIAATVMAHAIARARDRGCATITLQAVAGSYAESLYRKLGFSTAFVADVYSRQEGPGP